MSSKAGRALVIVPTYNEAENIERLVREILAQPAPLDVAVVDDNSPDGTGQLADALAQQDERVQVLHRAAKLGLGTAYIAGFKHALAQAYDYAITMDADFSHNPRYLPQLLGLMADYDLGIGSRYVRGGGSTGCSWSRVVLSKGANAFAKFMLGLKAHDCTAGFRCYKADVLRAIELDTIFSSGYSFLVEMVTRCQRRGYRVGEIPIIFDNRRLGKSKISRVEILKSVYTIFRLRFAWLPWERWAAAAQRRKSRLSAQNTVSGKP
ncbi:MAG: polyprenol monophosphomannose synthase [Chloroflexi bacterium]|nr:polyprenol monophosphomannose synthase [Chloroflexota bacterium]